MYRHFTSFGNVQFSLNGILIIALFVLLPGEIRVKSIDPEDVIERIFSPTGSGILPDSIPLPQMVDILIDFWEADGLFD
jgi:Tol biopolymer transport system component